MEENKIVKYEGDVLQKVKNAIEITNKLLNTDFRKIEVVHFSEKADKSKPDINDVVKQLRELGLTDEIIKEGLKQAGDTDAEIESALGSNNR